MPCPTVPATSVLGGGEKPVQAWVVSGRPGTLGRVERAEVPVPAPGPGELLVRVRVCGVCRTDLHLADLELPPRAERRVPGHEIVGDVVASGPSCPFWVHGSQATLRGSVLVDSDRLEFDDGDQTVDLPLEGAWFVDGFAATLGELMCAVAEDRQPENSAADVARTVALVLAAAESADADGAPVAVGAP